jgi:hypothetical protein
MQYAIKILITSIVVLLASETAKRFPALGGVIIALPTTSLVVMCFLYYDTKNAAQVAEFSRSIPPIIIVSIVFFYGFSYLIDRNFSFVMSISLSLLLMFSVYGLYLFLATRIGL